MCMGWGWSKCWGRKTRNSASEPELQNQFQWSHSALMKLTFPQHWPLLGVMHSKAKWAAWLRGIRLALPWDYILLFPGDLFMDSLSPSFTTQQVLNLVSQAVNPNPSWDKHQDKFSCWCTVLWKWGNYSTENKACFDLGRLKSKWFIRLVSMCMHVFIIGQTLFLMQL